MNIYLLNTAITGLVLLKLLKQKIKISGIVSVKKECAKEIAEYYDYGEFCKECGITHIEVESYSLRSDNDKRKLLNLDIDLIITASWQRLVPQWLINHCRLGIIGSHGSCIGISGGRGRSPQNWALLLGSDRFYISIFWIDSRIDSGRVIDTREIQYRLVDDISTSYYKVSLCVADMIIENLANGNIAKTYGEPQCENGGYLPKRIADDGKIDWNRKCEEIYNFIRALTLPYPCAFTIINNHRIKIIRAKFIESSSEILSSYKIGEIVMVLAESFFVKCGNGIIEVCEYSSDIEIKEAMQCESCDFKEQMRNIIKRHNDEVGLKISPILSNFTES